MNTQSRLRELLDEGTNRIGVFLGPSDLDRLEQFWQLLAQWNAQVNLTSLLLHGYPASTIDRLILEPLAASSLMPDSAFSWIDVGSGGGSPAIPMKIARPAARLAMVESRAKKAAFLREAVRVLRLSETTVINGRVEELWREGEKTESSGRSWKSAPGQNSAQASGSDFVTVRAVTLDAKLAAAVRTMLKPSGRLLLFASTVALNSTPAGFELVETRQLEVGKAALQVLSPRARH